MKPYRGTNRLTVTLAVVSNYCSYIILDVSNWFEMQGENNGTISQVVTGWAGRHDQVIPANGRWTCVGLSRFSSRWPLNFYIVRFGLFTFYCRTCCSVVQSRWCIYLSPDSAETRWTRAHVAHRLLLTSHGFECLCLKTEIGRWASPGAELVRFTLRCWVYYCLRTPYKRIKLPLWLLFWVIWNNDGTTSYALYSGGIYPTSQPQQPCAWQVHDTC